MMYAGSKSKLASRIVPVLNSMRKHGQSYVEPFMGFCSVLSRMDGYCRCYMSMSLTVERKKEERKMKVTKIDVRNTENVIEALRGVIRFSNGMKLQSYHEQDYREKHWLSFSDLSLEDFEGLEFDLQQDSFFERIEGYGIAIKPTFGFQCIASTMVVTRRT